MLKHYRVMVALSRQMCEAARLASWEQLVELGQQRDQVQAQLQAEQQVARQNGRPAERAAAEETELVAALLAANTEIQRLVDDHLATLPQALTRAPEQAQR
jgi:hypothetical protein